MAVYKRGGVWWFSFVFCGRRFQESANTSRKTIALEAEKNRRLELERAMAGLPTEDKGRRIKCVSDLIKEYLQHYPSNHREKSVIFAKQRLAEVQKRLGPQLLIDLKEDRIREYIKARLEDGMSGRTINMELGELSRAIGVKWSVAWPRVRKLEENHDIGIALSPDQEKALLEAAAEDDSPNRNPMLYTFLRIALTTGMRSGEICSLAWEQVDFTNGVITVGKAKTRAGSGRQIPMNADVRAALEMHLSWYASPKRFGEAKPEWYVFPGRLGRPKAGEKRPMDPARPLGSISSAWDAIREKAGIKCRLHDLRHTAATKMAEVGVPESTMLALMGHMSRAMLERYSHVRMTAKRAAVASLSLPKLTGNSVKDATGEQVPNPVSTISTTQRKKATLQ